MVTSFYAVVTFLYELVKSIHAVVISFYAVVTFLYELVKSIHAVVISFYAVVTFLFELVDQKCLIYVLNYDFSISGYAKYFHVCNQSLRLIDL